MRSLSVLHLRNGVVTAFADYLLLLHFRVADVVYEGPAYSSAAAGVDESVLRTGVEGIFPVYEFRMQADVALLRAGFQVRQSFPVHEVPGAGDAAAGRGGGKVGLGTVVLALYAEKTVYPSVFVRSQAHIIYVRSRLAIFGHSDRSRPETEIVHSVGTLRHCEEGLAVVRLHSGYEQVSAVPFDGAAVEDCVYAYPLHKERIVLLVEFVSPLDWSVRCREYRVLVTFVNAVDIKGFVLAGKEIFVLRP